MVPGLPAVVPTVVWEPIPMQAQPPLSVMLVSPTPTGVVVAIVKSALIAHQATAGSITLGVPTAVIVLVSVNALVIVLQVNTIAAPAQPAISVSSPTVRTAREPL